MATELVLIRHGHALHTRGQNYLRAPLTERGRQQAAQIGEYFVSQDVRFGGFYSSPLRRAVETASIIGERIGQTPVIRAGLREMEYRELPATIVLELIARWGIFDSFFDARIGKPFRWPLIGRVVTVLAALLTQHPGQQVCLVIHGGVISGIMASYFPRERRRWWRENVENCSITRLRVDKGCAELLDYNKIVYSLP